MVQAYTIASGSTGPYLRLDNAADALDSISLGGNASLAGLYITAGFGDANNVPLNYNGFNLTFTRYDNTIFTQYSGIFTAPAILTFTNIDFYKYGGTFTEGTGKVVFHSSIYNVTTTETFYDVEKTTSGSLVIALGDTMVVAGTLTLTDGVVNTGTIEAKQGISIATTFDGGSAAITMNGDVDQTLTLSSGVTPTGTLTVTKALGTAHIAGSGSLHNINLTQGTLNFDGGYTYTIDDADTITTSAGTSLNFAGTAGNLVTLRSDAAAQWSLNVNAAASYTADYVDVQYSDASGGRKIYASNSSGSNTTNWEFTSAGNRYWVRAAGTGDWTDSNNWSTISGGEGGAPSPDADDSAIFDASGAGNSNLDATVSIINITNAGGYGGTLDGNGQDVNVTGDFQFDSGVLDLDTGTWTVAGNWDTSSLVVANLIRGSSTVTMTGTDKTISTLNNQALNNINIEGTITQEYQWYYAMGTMNITGTYTLKNEPYVNGALVLGDTGACYSFSGGAAERLRMAGTFNSAGGTLNCHVRFENSRTLPARTYGGNIELYSNNDANHAVVLSAGTTTFSGNLALTSLFPGRTMTLDGTTNDPTVNVTGNISFDASLFGSEIIQTGSNNWNVSGSIDLTGGTLTTEGTNTFILDSAAQQNITSDGESFNNLTVKNTHVNGARPVGTLAVGGDLLVQADGASAVTLDNANNVVVNVTGGLSTTGAGAGAKNLKLGTGATWQVGGSVNLTGGTLDAGTSTLVLAGTAADQTLTSDTKILNNLQINNTAADPANDDVIIADPLDVNGTFTLTDGELDLDTNDPTVNIAGDITLNGGSITKSSPSAQVTFDGDLTYTDNVGGLDFGDVAIGTSPDTTNLGSNFKVGHLQINGGDVLNTDGYDIDAGGNITTVGTLNATAGAGGATQINLEAIWNNTGVFTQDTSTVTFDGNNQSILGSTTFNNLSKTNGNVTLTFTAGTTQTIAGNLTLTGTAGNLLSLHSSASPAIWTINIPATKTLNYLSVKDSTNTGVLADPANSTNEGNTTNWFPVGGGGGSRRSSPTVSTATASPTSLEINQTSTITITLKDSQGKKVANHQVTMTSDQGGDTIWYNLSRTNGQGQILGYLSSGSPHTSTLTITDVTDNIILSAHPQVTFNAPAISNPGDFIATVGNQEVSLSWTNPSEPSFDHINIYRSTTSGELGDLTASIAGTSYTDTDLTNGVAYFYTLKAVDSYGNISSGTEQLSAVPPGETTDTTPPTAPSNLRASQLAATYLTLAWDPASDDTGVTGYQIFNVSSEILVGTTTDTSFKLTGLTPETSYRFYVRAYDAAANFSPYSNTLTLTTLAGLTDEEKALKEQGGIAAYLMLSGVPEEVIAGVAFQDPVKVSVADAGGNILAGYAKAIFFSSSDPQAKLTYSKENPYTFTPADQGKHEFAGNNFVLSTLGSQKISVSDYSVEAIQETFVKSAGSLSVLYFKAAEKVQDFLADPENTADINTGIITAAAAVLSIPTIINTALGLVNIFPQVLYWLTHMLQALGIRRRRKPWGVVFNSQAGQPIPWAIVRILETHYKRVLERSVTDSQGRYGFLVRPGIFYLKVQKSGFTFPPAKKTSTFYEKVYTGKKLKIASINEIVAFNIPLDPRAWSKSLINFWVGLVRFNRFLQKIHLPMLILGFIFALIMLFKTNFGLIFILSVVFYLLAGILEFLRTLKARPYGVVVDNYNHPIEMAIVRIYQKNNNRLVETDVTDRDGRFKFLVSPGTYYIIAAKPGYIDFKSHLMYLRKEKTMVSVTIKLEKIMKD